MRIARASARQFRNFSEFELVAHPDCNLFIGSNGSGKTSILEALHLLGRGVSHRDIPQALVQHGTVAWRVEGSLQDGTASPPRGVRLSYSSGRLSVDVDHHSARALDLVRLLPLTIVDPYQHRLVEEGPAVRRRFFDWGTFHVEQHFYAAWRRTERALKQRNALLKQPSLDSEQMRIWNRELARSAEEVAAYRALYIRRLALAAQDELRVLLPEEQWQLDFERGWSEEPYAQLLEARLERDRRQGHTVEGPHRAELRLRRDGRVAKSVLSRGQQKLLLFALALAQARLVGDVRGSPPVVLVDDFTAELSGESQQRLAEALARYPGQKFVTALDEPPAMLLDKQVFHVEHGCIHPLVN
jgi:DNA replication and repair protein RecF